MNNAMTSDDSRGAKRRLAAGVLCALATAGAAAQQSSSTPAAPRDTAHFGTLRPDNGFRDWSRAYQAPGAFTGAAGLYSGTAGYERADGQGEMVAGYYRSLSESLSSLVETSYLPAARGLTEWSVLGQMGAMLGDGWGVQAGVRHSELGLGRLEGRRTEAQLGLLTLEKVWQQYRSQYTVYTSRRDNGGEGGGHRFSLDYLYGYRSSIGLSYGRAWSSDPQVSAVQVPVSAASALGVTGEHWLSREWAVNYDALFQQDGANSGLVPEIRVGLRLAF